MAERKVKKMWRVGGVELMSSVLQYDDEADWFPKLQQIQELLSTDNERGFIRPYEPYSINGPALHVHVAIGGNDAGFESPLGFACIKNVLALYGLFEDEIGRWLTMEQRDDEKFAVRIWHGQEGWRSGGKRPAGREGGEPEWYTPQIFTRNIYAAKDIEALRVVISGHRTDKEGRWVTVNLSPARDNKPLTVEFRQHHGTLDAVTIKWWTHFVCHLVRYGYLLAQLGKKIQGDDDLLDTSLGPQKHSFVQNITLENSILDLVGPARRRKSTFRGYGSKVQK